MFLACCCLHHSGSSCKEAGKTPGKRETEGEKGEVIEEHSLKAAADYHRRAALNTKSGRGSRRSLEAMDPSVRRGIEAGFYCCQLLYDTPELKCLCITSS